MFFFDPFTKTFPHILYGSPMGVFVDKEPQEMPASCGLLIFVSLLKRVKKSVCGGGGQN